VARPPFTASTHVKWQGLTPYPSAYKVILEGKSFRCMRPEPKSTKSITQKTQKNALAKGGEKG